MNNFVQYMPTKVVFGKNTEENVGRLVREQKASKVLIVYGGKSAVSSGLLDRVKKALLEEDIIFRELGGVRPNPRLSLAREGVGQALDMGAELILAIGGGSAIDTAKGISVGAANPGEDIWDFWTGKKTLEKTLPVGVVLTISAAGSETSDSAVLTDESTGVKKGIGSELVRPVFAIMNPELTYTLPKYQIACGIVDISMHTLERYFSPGKETSLTDEFAEGLLRTLIKFGPELYRNPCNYEAASEVMWCGSISHNNLTGLGRGKEFICHKMGHELSAKYDTAHGATLSALWGSWARYALSAYEARFAGYGRRVWGLQRMTDRETALAAIEKTEAFFREIDMPVSLGETDAGIQTRESLEAMACQATNGGQIVFGSEIPIGKDEMMRIYEAANH